MSRTLPALVLHVLLLIYSANISPAWTATTSQRNIIGFSSDGRWFAFEQFGVEDGSGFPFAELFVLDTLRDEWAKSTPVRVKLNDEGKTLHGAFNALRKRGQSILDQKGIKYPADLLASAPITMGGSPVQTLTFKLQHPWGKQVTLRLETLAVGWLESCLGIAPALKFSLHISYDSGLQQIAYSDNDLPRSRGCPVSYSLSDVVTPIWGSGDQSIRLVVLVQMQSPGFEGKDVTFLAVPISIPISR